mmetsp:Transcript_33187/g.93981  ORF Transcript_33187/g.93981 Transcript_33187/m.93981 type:complete len:510 (+) Transcript_33187:2938-4467(+)
MAASLAVTSSTSLCSMAASEAAASASFFFVLRVCREVAGVAPLLAEAASSCLALVSMLLLSISPSWAFRSDRLVSSFPLRSSLIASLFFNSSTSACSEAASACLKTAILAGCSPGPVVVAGEGAAPLPAPSMLSRSVSRLSHPPSSDRAPPATASSSSTGTACPHCCPPCTAASRLASDAGRAMATPPLALLAPSSPFFCGLVEAVSAAGLAPLPLLASLALAVFAAAEAAFGVLVALLPLPPAALACEGCGGAAATTSCGARRDVLVFFGDTGAVASRVFGCAKDPSAALACGAAAAAALPRGRLEEEEDREEEDPDACLGSAMATGASSLSMSSRPSLAVVAEAAPRAAAARACGGARSLRRAVMSSSSPPIACSGRSLPEGTSQLLANAKPLLEFAGAFLARALGLSLVSCTLTSLSAAVLVALSSLTTPPSLPPGLRFFGCRRGSSVASCTFPVPPCSAAFLTPGAWALRPDSLLTSSTVPSNPPASARSIALRSFTSMALRSAP